MDLVERLAPWIEAEARARPGLVVGLAGPQGSGKSTLAAGLARRLTAGRLRPAVLSLDDLYLRRAERRTLAERVHPLLAVRGPPGTHDVALGLRTLDALRRPGPASLPRFDKAADDRGAEAERFTGPANVVLLEGWCLGVQPEPAGALAVPVNALERARDADGRWRAWVHARLGADYPPLWARLDRLVVLQPPSFDVVLGWRLEQERSLRERTGKGMSDAEVAVFVQHFERLSRALMRQAGEIADLVVTLDERRGALAVEPGAARRGQASNSRPTSL